MKPFRIFIGYDSREPMAYHVLSHSIMRRATIPVSFVPLALPLLASIHNRPKELLASTEFAITRYLTPYLSGFEGWSLFMDCDMLCLADIAELAAYADASEKALLCCQHNYTPKQSVKFLNQTQTVYPRKNWSSLMLFNNARCKELTPEYVLKASGMMLHRFWWLDDEQIGALPLEWNWLVGEYKVNANAKILHYTNGGPWFYTDADRLEGIRPEDALWDAEFEVLKQASEFAVLAANDTRKVLQ